MAEWHSRSVAGRKRGRHALGRSSVSFLCRFLLLILVAPPALAQHGWAIATHPGTGGPALVHLPPRDGEAGADGSYRMVTELHAAPERLAAWDARAWMVFPPEGGVRVRLVRSVSAVRSGLGGLWAYEPVGRLDPHPSLPGEGFLAAVSGTPEGPVALLVGIDGASLLRLTPAGWQSLGPPDDLDDLVSGSRLGMAWNDRGLWIVALHDDRADLWLRGADADGESAWERFTLAAPSTIGPGARVEFVGSGPHLAVVVCAGARAEAFGIEPDGFIDLARFVREGGSWTVSPTPVSGRIALLWRELVVESDERARARATAEIAEVSAATGAVLYHGQMRASRPVSSGDFRLLAVVLLGVMVVVIALLMRPTGEPGVVALPPGVALASRSKRIAASLVDLLLAAGGASIITGAPISEVLSPFTLFGITGSPAEPLTALAVAVAHATIGEWLGGLTLGKWLVGIRVVRADADRLLRPALWRAAARNAFKWFLAPWAVAGLMTLNARHRGDLMGGTVVVEPVERPPAEPPDDNGA
ncbi:MAG: RDD family protein [Phycisphaerales bacterium]|nr:RDD family protein [Phycisphaerales bacterium]